MHTVAHKLTDTVALGITARFIHFRGRREQIVNNLDGRHLTGGLLVGVGGHLGGSLIGARTLVGPGVLEEVCVRLAEVEVRLTPAGRAHQAADRNLVAAVGTGLGGNRLGLVGGGVVCVRHDGAILRESRIGVK
jgi:hypothetical protein